MKRYRSAHASNPEFETLRGQTPDGPGPLAIYSRPSVLCYNITFLSIAGFKYAYVAGNSRRLAQ